MHGTLNLRDNRGARRVRAIDVDIAARHDFVINGVEADDIELIGWLRRLVVQHEPGFGSDQQVATALVGSGCLPGNHRDGWAVRLHFD